MTSVRDETRGVFTTVQACRTCAAPIYWSYTSTGKWAPYDIDQDGQPTRVSHFSTCPDARAWRKKGHPS